MDTESILADDDDTTGAEGDTLSSEPVSRGFPSQPTSIPQPNVESGLHVAGRSFQDTSKPLDPSQIYSQNTLEKENFEEEEILDPFGGLGAIGGGLGNLVSIGSGMLTGVKEISYNTYVALVIGRDARKNYHAGRRHTPKSHLGTANNAFRNKQRKQGIKRKKALKINRGARRNNRGAKQRKRL